MKIEKALWVGIALLFLYCCWLLYRDLNGLSGEINTAVVGSAASTEKTLK
jgi:hypothetical protein